MKPSPPKSILRAAGSMGAGTMLSRVSGLIRETVFAYLFGASAMMDAFQVAFRIPNLLRDLFAEGAMSASLVPLFVEAREGEGLARAWQLFTRACWILLFTVSFLACLGVLFAPTLVHLYAPKFSGEQFLTTVTLTQMMMPFFPAVCLAAAFMAILNAQGFFFMPAVASAGFNISATLVGFMGAWFQVPPFTPIQWMSFGVVVGGCVQAAVQVPTLLRIRPEANPPPLPWNEDRALGTLFKRMLPGTLGLAATQLGILINTVLATRAETGAVSWLSYAFRLLQLPIGVFGVSLASATLPRVSTAWHAYQTKKSSKAFTEAVDEALGFNFLINVPAQVFLFLEGTNICRILFERGQFTVNDSLNAGLALGLYAFGLVGYAAVKILVPVCYATGATKIPLQGSVLAVLLTLALNLGLVDSWGFSALALGTGAAAIFNALYLLLSLRHQLQSIDWSIRPLLGSWLRAHAFGVLLFLCLQASALILPFQTEGYVLRLFCSIGLSGLLFLIASLAARRYPRVLPEFARLSELFFPKREKI